MGKLNIKTTEKESHSLIKVRSKPTKYKILEIIDEAKEIEKGKSIDDLWRIVYDYSKEIYLTKPDKFSETISSTGETAFQRAIFLSGKTPLDSLGEIVWNDLELPVVFNKSPRRNCIDLIGTLNDKTSVLCELKFADKKRKYDSPIYAVIELLVYYYFISDNCDELDKKKVFHKNKQVIPFEWSNFNLNSIFIIGANEDYWKLWKKCYEKQKSEIDSWLGKLPIKVRFFSSPNFNFEEQKGYEKKYTPRISYKKEWTEIYINN